jgi:hypothetical protein
VENLSCKEIVVSEVKEGSYSRFFAKTAVRIK